MNRSLIISSVLHSALILITAMSLPCLAKKPLDIPPIVSADTIGGISSGFFAKQGRLIAVIKIKALCKTEEIIKLLFTLNYLCFNGSDINATLVKPEPDNKPIISSTLP